MSVTKFSEIGLDVAERGLSLFSDALNRAGAEHFLVGGALLGAVRGNRLIPHDKDIDIGVVDEGALYRLPSFLKAEGYPTGRYPVGPRGGKILWSRILLEDGKYIPVEIQAHYTFQDKGYRNCHMGPSWSRWWAGNISWPKACFEVFGETEISGKKYRTPGHVNIFLSSFYGDDWKEEKEYSDWRYNAANLSPGFINATPVVAIAGATRGVGRFVAKQLLEKGWAVSGFGRTAPDEARENYLSTAGDVTNAEDVQRWIERTQERFGYIDALFYSAGIVHFSSIENTTPEVLLDMLRADVVGLLVVSKAILPTFRRQEEGHIILLSSSRALTGAPRKCAYSASKHASRSLLESISKETGIRSTILASGAIYTAEVISLYGKDLERAAIISLSDISRTVEYILSMSPESRPPILRVGGTL